LIGDRAGDRGHHRRRRDRDSVVAIDRRPRQAALWVRGRRPDAAEGGAILAGDLSGASARLLQMVALGFTSDLAAARDIIRRTCE